MAATKVYYKVVQKLDEKLYSSMMTSHIFGIRTEYPVKKKVTFPKKRLGFIFDTLENAISFLENLHTTRLHQIYRIVCHEKPVKINVYLGISHLDQPDLVDLFWSEVNQKKFQKGSAITLPNVNFDKNMKKIFVFPTPKGTFATKSLTLIKRVF